MNLKKKLLIPLILLISGLSAFGQSCPPNVDFELGTYADWLYYRGTVATGPIFTLTACAGTPGWQTITTGAGVDRYGNFPIVDPGGGFFALKIGHDTNEFCAERASYLIHVPTGSVDYSLIYRYAVVFENPTAHTAPEMPTFMVDAYDSATGAAIPCAQFTYVAGGSLPGFHTSTVTSAIAGNGADVLYRDWATASINLSGWGGHTVEIDFTAGDCTLGGHFGYGYLDMACSLFKISSLSCGYTSVYDTLVAPPGFNSYAWYDSATFTTSYGTSDTAVILIPSVATTYAVVMNPYVGYGCPDTLYASLRPSHLQLHPSDDTLLCNGSGITITSGATDIALPLTYVWSPSTGLSCTTCASPFATATGTTSYMVTVTDAAGCSLSDTIKISIDNFTVSTASVNPTCYLDSNGSTTITVLTGIPPFSYQWNTTPIQYTGTASHLKADTFGAGGTNYTVYIQDNIGCKDTETVNIHEPNILAINIAAIKSPDSCGVKNGVITIGGLVPSETFTIAYTYHGTVHTQSGTANGSGDLNLTGLDSGTYTNFNVVIGGCQYFPTGPVTLMDPVNPSAPVPTSNTPVCQGTVINLAGADATDSVFFSWIGPAGFISNQQNPIITPAQLFDSGYYVLTVMKNLCFSKDSAWVTMLPYPNPVAFNNSTLCTGDTLKLNSFSTNGGTYFRWYGPNGYSSNQQNPILPNVSMLAAGTYTVYISNGCLNETTTDVTINLTPQPPLTTDTNYCQNAVAAPLTALGTNVLWFTSPSGGVGLSAPPVPSTKDTGTTTWWANQTIAGCTSYPMATENVTVYYLASPYISLTDSVLCLGSDVTFTAEGTGNDITILTWSFSDGDSIYNHNPVEHNYVNPGSYTVYATAYYKYCPVEYTSYKLNVFTSPSIYLGKDTAICLGGQPLVLVDNTNISNPKATWLWNTGMTGPSITVREPGIYYVKVKIDGCSATDTVLVSSDCYMELPNVFTPNGDGVNDYFFPRTLLTKGLITFSMNIYNRWGQLVFTTNSLDGMGWDGTFNGVPQPEGVFVYHIDATFKDGQIEHHTGNITLIR